MIDYRTTKKWECIYKMEGVRMIADNHTDLVTQLRKFAYDKPKTNKQHRDRSYDWFLNVDGIKINKKNDTLFVLDLIEYGYVKILGCGQKSSRTLKND